MALLLCDGLDTYTSIFQNNWYSIGSDNINPFSLSTTGGRFGGNAWTCASDNDTRISRPIIFTYSPGYTLQVGFWFYQDKTPASNLGSGVGLKAGMFGLDSWISVSPNTIGKLIYYPYGTATANATAGAYNICDKQWHWIELQIVLSTTTSGSVKIYVDGQVYLTLPSLITVASGTPGGVLFFGSGGNYGATTCTNFFDDIVIWDNTGTSSDLKAFPLGPQRIGLMVPTGAGDSTQYTPSTGANYAVAAQPWTGTASLTDSGTGNLDLYNHAILPFIPGNVTALVTTVVASNLGPSTLAIVPKVKSGGTIVNGNTITLTAASTARQSAFLTDSGGSPWTVSSVNASQIGFGD